MPEHPPTSLQLQPGNAPPLLNPHPRVSVVPIFDDHQCVIVDDFMLEPTELIEYAARNHAHFRDDPRNYYPGPELPLGGAIAERLRDAFLQYARVPLKARRVNRMMCRLSLVTRGPDDVVPAQRLPHRDVDGLPDGEGAAAMVLYLFEDVHFGGTSFFKPTVPIDEVTALLADLRRRELAVEAPPAEIPATYAIASSRYFDKVLTVAPRFNRAHFLQRPAVSLRRSARAGTDGERSTHGSAHRQRVLWCADGNQLNEPAMSTRIGQRPGSIMHWASVNYHCRQPVRGFGW